MDKQIISSKQSIALLIMFLFGSTLVLGAGFGAKQDTWLSVVIAAVAVIPMLMVYARILSLFPGKGLFDILQYLFGSYSGKAIMLLFVWYAFHLGALVIRNLSEFIELVGMPETPQYVIIIFMGLLCIWAIKGGIEVLGRWTLFIIYLVMVAVFLEVLLSLLKSDLANIKPILSHGFRPVLLSAFGLFSFPFAETVLFTMVFGSLGEMDSKYKVYLKGLGAGALVIFLGTLRNILVLGKVVSIQYFPSYAAVSLINIADFIHGVQVVVSTVFLLAGFVKISVCLYAASTGIAKILNINDYKSIVAPVAFLMMGLASFIYSSTMEMYEWAFKVYSYYALPFQVILPIFIWIVAEVKTGFGKGRIDIEEKA